MKDKDREIAVKLVTSDWPDFEILDKFGTPQSKEWLAENFGIGLLFNQPVGQEGWHLVRVKENADIPLGFVEKGYRRRLKGLGIPVEQGKIPIEAVVDGQETMIEVAGLLAPAAILVKVLDPDGNPVEGVPICWWWPDAPPKPPDACVPDNGLPEGINPGRYDGPGLTNGNGDWGGAMGHGAYYDPHAIPFRGPHGLWVCDQVAFGMNGLGMIAGTNHTHLDLTIQWKLGDEVPPDCRYAEIENELQGIEGRLANIRALMQEHIFRYID